MAWWMDDWSDWAKRTAEQNEEFRRKLFDRGEYDGYLLYRDDQPVGWCQCGPRDRLPNLVGEFGFKPEADVWALTCFLIVPGYRKRGLMRKLVAAVLDDLRTRGVTTVEAYPKTSRHLDDIDLWNGPEQVFLDAGFSLLREAGARRIYRRVL